MRISFARVLVLVIASPAAPLAFAQTAGWTENAAHTSTTTGESVGIGPAFAQPAPATFTDRLDVDGTGRIRGNLFLGAPNNANAALYFWPDPSGSYIAGTGTGLQIVGKGGLLTLSNADTVITGYAASGAALSVTAAPQGSYSAAFKDSGGTNRVTVAGSGTTVFTSSALINTSATVTGGNIALAGYPTKISFGNGQFIQDNANGNMRIFGGWDLSIDTSTAGIHLAPANGFVGVNTSYYNPPTVPLDVYNAGNAFIRARGAYADLILTSGNGSTSNRYSCVDMNSSESQPMTWRAGMNGTLDYTLTDMTNNTARMTMTRAGEFTVNGNISATGTINAKYQDVAEWVPATVPMEPGTVVVVDAAARNTVTPSDHAYDTRVAGVISAQPGVMLGVEGASKAKVSTTGRVKVRVDATRAPVAAGDLLVTSDKAGLAMRSEPIDLGGVKIHRPGTLIGKALEPLERGEGEILVLLTLQ